MNIHDRYFIFKKNSGELVCTCNDFDELYTRLFFLSRDLTNNYMYYDNLLNDYFEV